MPLVPKSVSIKPCLGAVTFNFAASNVGTASAHTTDAGVTNATNLTLANDGSAAISIGALGVSFFITALENIATLRAVNGATANRLTFSEEHLQLSETNLRAANSRIMDEMWLKNLPTCWYNILSQVAAVLAQANMAPNTALMLLG